MTFTIRMMRVALSFVLLFAVCSHVVHAGNLQSTFIIKPLQINSVALDIKQTKLLLDFNKLFFNASNKTLPVERINDLRAGMLLSTNPEHTFEDCLDMLEAENSTCRTLAAKDALRVTADQIEIRFIEKLVPEYDEFDNYVPLYLLLKKELIRDVSGNYMAEQKVEIPFDINGPVPTRYTLTNSKKTISLFFDEPIKEMNLKSAIQIATTYENPEAEQPVPLFEPLKAGDRVKVLGNMLEINVASELPGCHLFVKVVNDSIVDLVDNKVAWGVPYTDPITKEVRTIGSTFRVVDDCDAPESQSSANLNFSKDTVTVFFNEAVSSAITTDTKDIDLRKAIKIAPYPSSYTGESPWEPEPQHFVSISSRSKVTFSQNQMVIKLTSPLSKSEANLWGQIKIAGNTLRDEIGNMSADDIVCNITTDTLGPKFRKMSVSSDNRRITFEFNEPLVIPQKYKPSPGNKNVSIKSAFSWNGNTPLAAKDNVRVSGTRIYITLNQPADHYNSELYLNYDGIADDWGNDLSKSPELDEEEFPYISINETAYGFFVPFDYTPPTVLSTPDDEGSPVYKISVGKDGKVITVEFDSQIMIAYAGKTANTDLKAAIRINSVQLNLKDRVSVMQNKLIITRFERLLSEGTYSLEINAGALMDIAGNAL